MQTPKFNQEQGSWKQSNNIKRFKRSDDNLKLPEDFEIGRAIADGNCFFDSFRQGLERQLRIKVTVEQLREDCKEFALNNPPAWFMNSIANSYDNNLVRRSETPISYSGNILNRNRWGDADVEGRILCGKYGVKLHVIEKSSYRLHLQQQILSNGRSFSKKAKSVILDSDSDQALVSKLQTIGSDEAFGLLTDMTAFHDLDDIHQFTSSSGPLALDNLDYNDKHTIHIINGGRNHFEPVLSTQEIQHSKQLENEYRKLYSDKDINFQKVKDLYLQTLTELEKAIQVGNIDGFKNLSELISYINEIERKNKIENASLPQVFFDENSNPIKDTNLVILACKYNKLDVLNYLFNDQTKILDNLSIDIGKSSINPGDIDKEGHTAFYYAIRSSNANLLDRLTKWPVKYFDSSVDSKWLNNLLSDAHKRLKLDNVPLSEGIEALVKNRVGLDSASSLKKNQQSPSDNRQPGSDRQQESGTSNQQNKNLKVIWENPPQQPIFVIKLINGGRKKKEDNDFLVVNIALQKLEEVKIEKIKEVTEGHNREEDKEVKIKEVEDFVTDFKGKNFIFYINQKHKLIALSGSGYGLKSEYLKKLEEKLHEKGITLVQPLPREDKIFFFLYLIDDKYPIDNKGKKETIGNSEKVRLDLFKKFLVTLSNEGAGIFYDFHEDVQEKLLDHNSYIYNDLEKLGKFLNELKSKGIYDRKLALAALNVFLREKLTDGEYKKNIKKLNLDKNEVEKYEKKYKEVFDRVWEGLETVGNSLVMQNLAYCAEDNLLDYLYNHSGILEEDGEHLIFNLFGKENFLNKETEQGDDFKIQSLCDICKITFPMYLKSIIKYNQLDVSSINFPLHHAAKFYNKKRFQELLSKTLVDIKGTINNPDEKGWTPLYYAAQRKNLEIVDLLYKNGADVNYAIKESVGDLADSRAGKTPLHNAAKHSSLEVVEYLVKLGADVNAVEKKYGFTPLHSACSRANEEITNFLIGREAEINSLARLTGGNKCVTPLSYTLIVKGAKGEPIAKLLLNKEEIDIKPIFKPLYNQDNKNDHDCYTAFDHAIASGQSEVVDKLISRLSQLTLKNLKALLNELSSRYKFKQDYKDLKTIEEIVKILINAGKGESNLTPLHLAAEWGRENVASVLLNKDADVDAKDKNDWTPLHYAARDGYEEVVDVLLDEKHKVNVNSPANNGVTPLHCAAIKGHKVVVKTLLENGANIEATDIHKNTALFYATDGSIRNILTSTQNLFSTIKNSDPEEEKVNKLKSYINQGAIVGATDNNNSFTLLHHAVQDNYKKIVDLLLENGVDVTRVTISKGNTPLHLAASKGYKEIVNTLLEYVRQTNFSKYKDFINAKTTIQGNTALHLAARDGYEEVVDVLLDEKHKVNVNSPANNGVTPLHCAAIKGHKVVVKTLLENGANIEATDIHKNTALFYATDGSIRNILTSTQNLFSTIKNSDPEEEKVNKLKSYINQGAIVGATDNNNSFTLLHHAVQDNYKKIVDLLLENGVDVTRVTISKGNTPLHLAASKGYKEIVNTLLEYVRQTNFSKYKDFINAKTTIQGNTALHLAAQNGHKDVVEALLSKGSDPIIRNNGNKTPLNLAKDKLAQSQANDNYQQIVDLIGDHIDELYREYMREQQEVEFSANSCLNRRRRRNISNCQFFWDDIDEFNAERGEKRDISKIEIDSERFINYIKDLPEEKRTQLIQLADRVQVTGKSEGLVHKLINNKKVMNHLNRVGRVSGIAMHGMMGKATLASFLNGDEKGVAINIGFIAGGQGFAKVAEAVSLKGTGLVADGKLMLGRSLKAASPFLARGTSAFIAYDLVKQIKEYKKGNNDALVGIVGDGIYLGVDTAEIGIEVAEGLELLEGVSSITGPIGAAIGAVVFVGTDIYLAVKRVGKINEIIHLKGNERFIEGLRAFIGIQPEQYIKELMERKQINNKLVEQGLKYLKQHSDVKRYVFPTGKSVIDSCRTVQYREQCPTDGLRICYEDGFGNLFVIKEKEKCTTKFQVDLDNTILLNSKRTGIKWSRAKPDSPDGGKLFCLPQEGDGQVSSNVAYSCENAIGVEDSSSKVGNYTFIRADEGNDYVEGFLDSPNVISVSNGFKKLYGGDKDDTFILQGSTISGSIDGRGGTNTIDLGGFAPELESILVELDKLQIGDLKVKQINSILARKDKRDEIHCDVSIRYVDGRGGKDENAKDVIKIVDYNCLFNYMYPGSCNSNSNSALQIAIRPYTIVSNYASRGNFSYIVNQDRGESLINLNDEPLSRNSFLFNHILQDINSIGVNITNFPNNSSRTIVKFTFLPHITSANITEVSVSSYRSASSASSISYALSDGTSVKIGEKGNLYAMQNSNRSIGEVISNYPAIANNLKMSIFVQSLLNNETIAIGHGNHDVLHNNPYHRSHLVGNGGENIFVVTSGYEILDNNRLPIPEVVIYDIDRENLIDTLDLRQIKQQIVKDLGKEVKAKTFVSNKDLLIELLCSRGNLVPESVVTVRLKDALATNWHERLHVIVDNVPMKIEEFELKPLPLIFDESDKSIIVIGPQDVEKENKVVLSREIGNYTFARSGNNLVITNAFDRNLTNDELCTISLNKFYQEAKMQTLSIKFADKEISLKDEMDRINNASTFAEQRIQYKNDTYNTVFNYSSTVHNTTVHNITDLHQRRRRDESEVMGYEDEVFFYGQNNANFAINDKQITSGAGRLSSWISDCATWVKDSIKGLIGNIDSTNKVIIDKNDQVFFSAQNNASFTIKSTSELSSFAKASLPTINTEYASQQQNRSLDLQNVDLDGTILLLDLLIRRITGQNYIPVNQDVSLLELQADALNITEEFGKILSTTCNEEEMIDLSEVQSNIFKAMMSGSGNKIPGILCSYLEEAKLEPEVTKKILAVFQPTKPPIASPSEGQTKHLPSLPKTAYKTGDNPHTCLSNIEIGKMSVCQRV